MRFGFDKGPWTRSDILSVVWILVTLAGIVCVPFLSSWLNSQPSLSAAMVWLAGAGQVLLVVVQVVTGIALLAFHGVERRQLNARMAEVRDENHALDKVNGEYQKRHLEMVKSFHGGAFFLLSMEDDCSLITVEPHRTIVRIELKLCNRSPFSTDLGSMFAAVVEVRGKVFEGGRVFSWKPPFNEGDHLGAHLAVRAVLTLISDEDMGLGGPRELVHVRGVRLKLMEDGKPLGDSAAFLPDLTFPVRVNAT